MNKDATAGRLVVSQPIPSNRKEMGVHYGGFDRIDADDWAQTHEPESLLGLYIRNQIEFAMKARGVTQAELAKRLGVTPANINIMLRRRENLTLDTVAKIFRQLDYFPLISLTQWDPPSGSSLQKRKKRAEASDVVKDKAKARMVTYFERMRQEQRAQTQVRQQTGADSVDCGNPPQRLRPESAPVGASRA